MFPYLTDLINYYLGTSTKLPFYTYGFTLVVATIFVFIAVYFELRRKGKNRQIPPDSEKFILTIIVIIVISGLVGLKLFHFLDHPGEFIKDPIGMMTSFSGLSFYGGLIFGCVAVWLYSRHAKIPIFHALDVAAPAILLGYAIGRLGCHFSGDGCWGIVNVSPQPGWLGFLPVWAWGFQYPHNVINAGIPISGCAGTHCNILPQPVFPTPLYEAFMALVAFLILWAIRKKITTPGWLFSIFLVYYSTSRFFIELIRVNPKYSFLGLTLTQAQYISIICFLLGVGSIWYFRWLSRSV
jgi:phosphatidylglycerol---prolipoprotein diacylglyceryl transferase